ncbi:hypothetical protein LWI29_034055 [Acer saccharum]|uniref:Protein kinase domain-containing protein n=1 Tax=Acer saccharum TaxID=4024 RepID=A0AA39SSH7_ACESA|nr:hypothetical protein LWI29_034055 [Acer saccharum]
MENLKNFFYALLLFGFSLAILVSAQDQSGFISIDCGIPSASGYNDENTGIQYISDATFVVSGITKSIPPEFQTNSLEKQFYNVRSFPEGNKNCYTLNPAQGKDGKYLIRARFMYGNYDGTGSVPQFDLHLGVNIWDTIKLDNTSSIFTTEIIHVPSTNYIYVCLVNTGLGTPFISSLELRLLKNSTYETQTLSESLVLLRRYDLGSITNRSVRFKDDIYDRIWMPKNFEGWKILSTSLTIDAENPNIFRPSPAVMNTAVTPENVSESLSMFWDPPNPTSKYYVYLHFAEVELLVNQTRELNVSDLSGKFGGKPFSPDYLYSTTNYNVVPLIGERIQITISKTSRSTLPPILNAIEMYMVQDSSQLQTDPNDVVGNKVESELENKNNYSFAANNRQFTYSDIVRITKNFERILGKGGFGPVFHGWLDDIQVAVKMLSSSSDQGYKEFHAEVKLLMRVHHRNLTSLVGYCIEDTNMGLIYEYMSNGTLQEYLSGKNAYILSWEDRMRIAVDAAQGLEYLHNGCKPSIVHRDVKSSNILLNEKLQAKIADFGLSRIFQTESGAHISTVVAGTPGYLDPEYYISNWLNEKSDVYSFGVVLLEIITSRPVIIKGPDENVHVSQWVSSMLAEGDIRNIVDPSLSGDFDNSSAWKVVELALACALHSSMERPTMTEVVTELNDCLAIEIARNDKGHKNKTKGPRRMVTVNVESDFSPTAR